MTGNCNRIPRTTISIITCAVLVAAASGVSAQQRPLSINDWLQAERANANMQRAVEQYERARFGTVTPPQPQYQQQAQTPSPAPQQPVQQQPIQQPQPLFPAPQSPAPQAAPGGQLPQGPTGQNTYQVPPDALEKIDREYGKGSPALASAASGYYVAAHVGWPFVGSSEYDFSGAAIDADMSMLSLHASGALGYELANGLSLELAGTYQFSTVDELTASASGIGISNDDVDGSVSIFAMLANAKYELPIGQNFTPYILGGLGPGMHFINDVHGAGATSSIDDSAFVLAYQFGVGLMFPMNGRTSFDVGYRYFGTTDAEMEFDGNDFDADFSNHTLMIGVTHQL